MKTQLLKDPLVHKIQFIPFSGQMTVTKSLPKSTEPKRHHQEVQWFEGLGYYQMTKDDEA